MITKAKQLLWSEKLQNPYEAYDNQGQATAVDLRLSM